MFVAGSQSKRKRILRKDRGSNDRRHDMNLKKKIENKI